MNVEEELINLPEPGVVFSATKFMTSYDWHDEDDAALWNDRVLVSFQKIAWVESTTYQHHINE